MGHNCISKLHLILSPFSGLFLVEGKREESDRADGEALPLRPPAGLPTHPPILEGFLHSENNSTLSVIIPDTAHNSLRWLAEFSLLYTTADLMHEGDGKLRNQEVRVSLSAFVTSIQLNKMVLSKPPYD